jgi:glycosyltransferase involved in cell wall biosynthesis
MKIAIFDYLVTRTNPIGGCHLGILKDLCLEHEFTVFSVQFENPCPERIRWVRIPAAKRPLVLLYITFHLMAPLCYLWHRFRYRVRFDFVQGVGSTLLFSDIVYSHFCNRVFLERHWKEVSGSGLRSAFRWMDHWLQARLEPWVYRRARLIVVPSQGLARELIAAYPYARPKIQVLANPVDIERIRPPNDFDRMSFRRALGLAPQDLVLVFIALGHYERKGLPQLLEALAQKIDPWVKLLVVGGNNDLVSIYQARARRLGLNGAVTFAGMQKDVRPYLWAADALALPSHYEVFPLVVLEGAAAGLPLLVTPLNGVEEFLIDGENGVLMGRTCQDVAQAIKTFSGLSPQCRGTMGDQARRSVERFSTRNFVDNWRGIYSCVRPQ